MSTSGSYDFSITRDQIITQAMLYLGLLGEAEVPTAQEVTDCSLSLNMLVKQWMGKQDFAPGLKMWSRQRADLFLSSTHYQYALGPSGDNWAAGFTAGSTNYGQQQLSATTASGSPTLTFGTGNLGNFTVGDYLVVQLDSGDTFSTTVLTVNSVAGTVTAAANLPSQASTNAYVWNYTTKGQRPLNIVTAILRDINRNDTPLRLLTLQEYEALPSKTQAANLSDPMSIYYESQLTNGQLYMDCGGAQDVTKHLHIVYLRPIQDFDNATDNPEYPQQWYRALCWGLAMDIAPMFDAEWTQSMQINLNDSLAMAREADSETTAMYFQPNDD